jgi:hypothetical protein
MLQTLYSAVAVMKTWCPAKFVIPGRAKREPGIHTRDRWLWIPGLRQEAHPGMTMVVNFFSVPEDKP